MIRSLPRVGLLPFALVVLVGACLLLSSPSYALAAGDGLTVVGGSYQYLRQGTPLTSTWKTVNGAKYYFDESGRAVTGAKSIKGTYYIFGDTGKVRTSSSCHPLVMAYGAGKDVVYNYRNATLSFFKAPDGTMLYLGCEYRGRLLHGSFPARLGKSVALGASSRICRSGFCIPQASFWANKRTFSPRMKIVFDQV